MADQSKLSQYVKVHERLIITLIVAVVLAFGYAKTVSYLDNRDNARYSQTTAVLLAQIEDNKKIDAEAKQIIAQYKSLAEKLAAENTALVVARSQRAVVVEKQQEVDRVMPPAELGQRWTKLLSVDSSTVQPVDYGFQVSLPTAVETVVQLEVIPQLRSDLAGADQIATNRAKQIDSLNGVVSTLQLQVSGRDAQIADQAAACTAEVAVVKSAARKSKLRWFAVGFVVGFVARHVL